MTKQLETCTPVDLDSEQEEIVVEVKDLTITYRSYKERPTSLKQMTLQLLTTFSLKYYSTFNALDKVSFKVKKGKVFGIIGSNGAGKSTLLKAISGVLPPTGGQIAVTGSLDSLISLGAGFDSELNAIENIYLYGSLHKRTRKEIAANVKKIIAFAELEEFATTPIKYYSSGMYARLGFACAIDREPDILIVDEVLAVGDERFQKKCRNVFNSYLENKKTIIMVSHGVNNLAKMADEIAVLSKGKLVFVGDPKEALEIYRAKDYQTTLTNTEVQQQQ